MDWRHDVIAILTVLASVYIVYVKEGEIHFMGDCQAKTDHCATEGAVCRPVGSLRQLRCACETETEYFSPDLQQCRKKIAFGERCLNRDDECLVDGASCQDGSNKCLCEHNHFLDTESAVCRRRLQYGETCQTDTDCWSSDRGVQCLQDGSSRKCLCQTDEFLDKESSVCRKKIAFGERCLNRDDECLVDGASCQDGSNKCLCEHNDFLDTESAVCRRMPDIENGHWRQSGNLWEKKGEKWIMSCDDSYYVIGCAVVRNYRGKWNRDMPECLSNTVYWTKWGFIYSASFFAAIYVAPVGLAYIGFSSLGITGGSIAASMMSYAAILNGGGVVTGSMVAMLQSAGVLGFSTAASAAIGAAGSATAAATQFLFWNNQGCEEV